MNLASHSTFPNISSWITDTVPITYTENTAAVLTSGSFTKRIDIEGR